MLHKSNRIKTKEFKRFWKKGKRITEGKFALNYRPYSWQTKLAVVVSKKENKTAVARNKLRRKIYEVWRTRYLPKMPENVWAIIFYQDRFENFSAEKLLALLDKFHKIQSNKKYEKK